MIKKIATVLSLILTISISSSSVIYAEVANKELLEGSMAEISRDLNKEVFKSSKEAILINEKSIVDSISATPLAYAKDAPILVTKNKSLGRVTRNYIKELGVEKITIIGGLNAVSKDIERSLEKMGISVSRIRGKDRYDTSLKIAREIYRTTGFDKAFLINSEVGLENAISVYSYAARNSMPIIWAQDDDCSYQLDFLKRKKLDKVYAIGDSEQFISDVESTLDNSERIKEINKSDTNTDLINKFYNKQEVKKVYTANVEFGKRSGCNEYISLGVVSAKENVPVMICNETLTYRQDKYIKNNNIDDITEVGFEIEDYSFVNAFITKTFISSVMLIILLIVITFRAFKYQA